MVAKRKRDSTATGGEAAEDGKGKLQKRKGRKGGRGKGNCDDKSGTSEAEPSKDGEASEQPGVNHKAKLGGKPEEAYVI